MNRKVIAIVGPTTAPGRGLIRAILGDREGPFVARAVTPDPSSEEALLLAMTGIEVVRGDLENEASLRQAFTGAYGVFCPWLPTGSALPGRKVPGALAVARAAKGAGLEHVIWATIDDTSQLAMPDEDVTPTYLDSARSAEADPQLESAPFQNLAVPTTFLRVAWRSSVATGPAAEEIGRSAYSIFRSRELVGKTVAVSEEMMALELARLPKPAANLPPLPPRKSRVGRWLALSAIGALLLVGGLSLAARFWSAPKATDEASATPPRARGNEPGTHIVPLEPPRSSTANPPTFTGELPSEARVPGSPLPVARPRPRRRPHPEATEPLADDRAANSPTERAPPAPTESPLAVKPPQPSVTEPIRPAARGPGANGALANDGPAPVSPPAGTLDPKAVTATIRAHAAEVRACFDRALMERSDLHGRLVVKALLDASGNVVTASATRTIDGGARLQACVLSAFQSWTFPSPGGGAKAPISYSFSFE